MDVVEVGYHATLKGGFASSVRFHHQTYGVRAFQMFMKGTKGWALSKLARGDKKFLADCQKCKEYVEGNGIFLVGHMGYTINMANPVETPPKSTLALAVDDMRVAHAIGACGVVFHLGMAVGKPVDECLDRMEQFVRDVLAETEGLFILETPAGQGSQLCTSLEDLGAFYARFRDTPRVKICLDTCHVFAAGYDLSSPQAVDEFLVLFEELIGWDNCVVVHLNDSKGACDCRKDRHENIGLGHIGAEGIRHFVREMRGRLPGPLILETPVSSKKRVDSLDQEESEIELIRRWLAE